MNGYVFIDQNFKLTIAPSCDLTTKSTLKQCHVGWYICSMQIYGARPTSSYNRKPFKFCGCNQTESTMTYHASYGALS